MFKSILGSTQVNFGENTEINKQSHVKLWFNKQNMELSHIYLAVPQIELNPNSQRYSLINYLETHADHANNPTMPTNAPMPSSQPQQPIQQVHVPAHVYFHR